jgi:hypothetical protein
MRMWMVNTKILCNRHLLGEHVETHMFVGTLKRKISITGYLVNNLFEPRSLFTRHNQLSLEMIDRGMVHKSALEVPYWSYLSSIQLHTKINADKSLQDLLSRCPECTKRYELLRKGNVV